MVNFHVQITGEPAVLPSTRLGQSGHRMGQEGTIALILPAGTGMHGTAPSTGVATTPISAVLSLCSDTIPERDRIAIFREVYGRQMQRVDVEPLEGHSFRVELTARMLPGLVVASSFRSPLRVSRTRALVADGDDALVVRFPGARIAVQRARGDVFVEPGEAIVLSNCDVGSVTCLAPATARALVIPRKALGPLLTDADDCIGRPIADTPALRLLKNYLDALSDIGGDGTAELQRLSVTHVYDLLAMALGATRDAAQLAKGRGVRAAHLRAIKKDILKDLGDTLSLDFIAARHRLTPRYVRMLFEGDGTTFTEFVREARLARAHRMLISPRFEGRRIADIALDAGFNDISYFNRLFRRRFGQSPSEVRFEAELPC